jgi:hypothetical protein
MTPTAVKTEPEFANHIERAKAILAGTYEPEPLRLPPDVQEWFDAEVKRWDPPGTPEAVIYQRNGLLLDAHYAGQHILYTILKNGTVAVLAVGSEEIRALRNSMTFDENKRAISFIPGLRG